MTRNFRRTIELAKAICRELENGHAYFMDEILYNPLADHREERKQNHKNILSLCDEIIKITAPEEVKYEQTEIN